MSNIIIESANRFPVFLRETEYVERKGLGHPDTICDKVADAISLALSQEYIREFGQVLHHNVDKALLVAGETEPKLGGGTVRQPMRLILGDRATSVCQGRQIDVKGIVQQTVNTWFPHNLRFVDASQHLVLQNELREGSEQLTGIYRHEQVLANDTSVGIGFAPLSETEQLVLAAEKFLNSPAFKQEHPATGEDIKVMGIRRSRHLHLTVAIAFVDRFIRSVKDYFEQKQAIAARLTEFLRSKLKELDEVSLKINLLDDPQQGQAGIYLTVLGTSAEHGDCGQVGRGNRINGLISLCRPMTLEAASGKNPVRHVGKVYSYLATQIAQSIHESIDAVAEANVWLCSQIGQSVAQPWFSTVEITPRDGISLEELRTPVAAIVDSQLASVASLSEKLIRGEFAS